MSTRELLGVVCRWALDEVRRVVFHVDEAEELERRLAGCVVCGCALDGFRCEVHGCAEPVVRICGRRL